jgi:sugar lactone lactonase YvrE
MTGHSALSKYEILPGTEGADRLGEGPWWESDRGYLYWVDIKGQRIRGSRLDGTEVLSLDTPSDVGFVVPAESGALTMGLRDGLYRWTPTRGFEPLVPAEYDTSTHRINDGKADRSGRLWYGTIHDQESVAVGHLYSYGEAAQSTVRGSVTTSNGIGWSPDNRTMYYTDSMAFTIVAYDFDIASGQILNPREFARDEVQRPDGLTVDAEGYVWSAKWDGGVVVRYDPSGTIVDTIRLPVSRPTSCMFVGDDLSTLAITSAKPDDPDTEPLAGSVFLVPTSTHGLPERRFTD